MGQRAAHETFITMVKGTIHVEKQRVQDVLGVRGVQGWTSRKRIRQLGAGVGHGNDAGN